MPGVPQTASTGVAIRAEIEAHVDHRHPVTLNVICQQIMHLSHRNLLVLSTALGFFGLQFVPHFVTSLGGIFDFAYPLLFGLAIIVTVISTVLIAGLWASAIDRARKRRLAGWCVTLLVVSAAAIGLNFASSAYASGLPVGSFARQFDSSLWRAPASERYVSRDITDRQKMLGDAIRKVIDGGNKDNIIKMLGPSDESGYFSSLGRDLMYRLGPERGFLSIDSEWLLIWLDGHGNVVRHEIWTD